MPSAYREQLAGLMKSREWVWIAGNHDPLPPADLGGTNCEELTLGGVTFRHKPEPACPSGEISGHLHPVARIVRRGKAVRRRCLVSDDVRMIMPAFGAFTGGLNIREPAFEGLFDPARLHAHLLGNQRVFTIGGDQLV